MRHLLLIIFRNIDVHGISKLERFEVVIDYTICWINKHNIAYLILVAKQKAILVSTIENQKSGSIIFESIV